MHTSPDHHVRKEADCTSPGWETHRRAAALKPNKASTSPAYSTTTRCTTYVSLGKTGKKSASPGRTGEEENDEEEVDKDNEATSRVAPTQEAKSSAKHPTKCSPASKVAANPSPQRCTASPQTCTASPQHVHQKEKPPDGYPPVNGMASQVRAPQQQATPRDACVVTRGLADSRQVWLQLSTVGAVLVVLAGLTVAARLGPPSSPGPISPLPHEGPVPFLQSQLHDLIPAGELWSRALAQLPDHSKNAQKQRRAWAMVLACPNESNCNGVGTRVSKHFRMGTRSCSLVLSTTNLPDNAGALQSTLVEHLRACPVGLIVLEDVQDFSIKSLTPVHNLLSEGGHLTHHGQPVLPGQNVIVMTIRVRDAAALEGQRNEAHGRIMSELEEALQGRIMKTGDYVEEIQMNAIRALRRRIALSFPVSVHAGDGS